MTKRIVLLEIYPDKNKKLLVNCIDAHLRNSMRIADILGADLLVSEVDYLRAQNKKFDCFILGYASHYAPFTLIKRLLSSNKEAKKIIISNEYNICPSVGGFRPYYLISNYECLNPKLGKSCLGNYFVNLNILLFNPIDLLSSDVIKKYDCLYYGTFRPNREVYFKKYLQKGIYLSTSIKNMKKFKHIGCSSRCIKKLNWRQGRETLRLFKYSLYIEDVYTHSVYNCLANRFYEAVMCNVVLFFDVNCLNTIRKSKLEIDDFFIVTDYKDLIFKIENSDYKNLLERQKHFLKVAIEAKISEEANLKKIIYDILT